MPCRIDGVHVLSAQAQEKPAQKGTSFTLYVALQDFNATNGGTHFVPSGGWKRYAQAHRKRLADMFASKLRLPADVIPLVVDFWANVGMY